MTHGGLLSITVPDIIASLWARNVTNSSRIDMDFPGFNGHRKVVVRTGGEPMGNRWRAQHVRFKYTFLNAHRREFLRRSCAVSMDLYSRRIVGWSTKHTLTQDLVLDTLLMIGLPDVSAKSWEVQYPTSRRWSPKRRGMSRSSAMTRIARGLTRDRSCSASSTMFARITGDYHESITDD